MPTPAPHPQAQVAAFEAPTASDVKFWPRTSPAFARCRAAVRTLPQQPYIVGVSGGADSLALAAALLAEGYPVYAMSVDHQLQTGSAAVAEQAITQLRAWGAYGCVQPVTVPAGENMEAAARTARYTALLTPGLPVVVAHTQDDQAETALLQLLRAHLTAMTPETTLQVDGVAGTVHRPFLTLRRADTQQACVELGLQVWEDPHNTDTRFRRVAMRRTVLPLLADAWGGDVVPSLAAAAQRAQQQQEFLDLHAQALYAAALQESPGVTGDAVSAGGTVPARAALRVAVLAAQPAIVTAAVIRLFARTVQVEVTQAQEQAILALIYHWHGQGPVAVSGGWAVYRRKGTLYLSKQEKRNS